MKLKKTEGYSYPKSKSEKLLDILIAASLIFAIFVLAWMMVFITFIMK